MKDILICLVLIIPMFRIAYGQSQGQNYISNSTLLIEGVKDPSKISSKPPEEATQRVQYFDGLGRSIQTVNTKSSPTYNDVVIPQQYDAFGREVKTYLPYSTPTTPGSFKVNATSDDTGAYTGSEQYLFYQSMKDVAHDQAPFSEVLFENSSLNRVLKQGAPGTNWKPLPVGVDDRAIEHGYSTNGINEVILFNYDMTTNSLVVSDLTYYAANQLYLNRTTDEGNHDVIEYIDKDGNMILKKVEYMEEDGTKRYAETYYIYDEYGSIVVVLPPEAVANIKSSFLAD